MRKVLKKVSWKLKKRKGMFGMNKKRIQIINEMDLKTKNKE